MAGHRPGEFSWGVFFRGVGKRLGLAPQRREPVTVDDPWTARREDMPSTPLALLIAEIEQDALAVYADHGLPTQPGHYARAPDERDWQFVAEHLTPEQRWSFVDNYPPEQGWRFTTLEDLGRYADVGERVVEAARVLRECGVLRNAATPMVGSETFERALRLGVAWRDLKPDMAWQEAEPVEIAKPKRLSRRKKPD